jgi:RND family efflux transporter MFP subunit
VDAARKMTRWLPAIAVVAALAVLLMPDFAGLRRGAADRRAPDRPVAQSRPVAGLGSDAPRADPLPETPVLAAVGPGFGDDPDSVSSPVAADAPDGEPVPSDVISAEVAAAMLDCIIEPYELVEIGSPVTGLIEKIHVERGDSVEAGQVLVNLESGVETAAVELARVRARKEADVQSREARLALGKRRQERGDELFERNALSLDERDQLETDAELARLELREARENRELARLELAQAIEALERRTILSPIPGVVVNRMLSEGEVVDEETILTVAQLDPLRVEVILPSAMFGAIRPGMRAEVTPEVPGDRPHVASVAIVDRMIDPASGTFGVRLELPNPDQAIPGGLHCQVRFLPE